MRRCAGNLAAERERRTGAAPDRHRPPAWQLASRGRRFPMGRVWAGSLACFLVAVGLPAFVLADDLHQACQSDAQQFCAGVQPGDWHLLKCLRQNKDQLSPPCQAALHTASEQMRACRSDAKQLCAGVPMGGGAMFQCLQQHQSQLSPECASGLASMGGQQPPNGQQPPMPQQGPASGQMPSGQLPPPAQVWYHCDNPQGYYPYVQTCSSGWHQVPATPPDMTSSEPPSSQPPSSQPQ